MNPALDPWCVTQREKIKYQEQFKTLQPQNGVVTGAQAKGFFLQSQLSPLTLEQIWALVNTDSDGKMNIYKFSIACKLINLKLKGFEIPKDLPPTLIASLSSAAGTPILTPTGSLSPLDPLKPLGNIVQATVTSMPMMPLPAEILKDLETFHVDKKLHNKVRPAHNNTSNNFWETFETFLADMDDIRKLCTDLNECENKLETKQVELSTLAKSVKSEIEQILKANMCEVSQIEKRLEERHSKDVASCKKY